MTPFLLSPSTITTGNLRSNNYYFPRVKFALSFHGQVFFYKLPLAVTCIGRIKGDVIAFLVTHHSCQSLRWAAAFLSTYPQNPFNNIFKQPLMESNQNHSNEEVETEIRQIGLFCPYGYWAIMFTGRSKHDYSVGCFGTIASGKFSTQERAPLLIKSCHGRPLTASSLSLDRAL